MAEQDGYAQAEARDAQGPEIAPLSMEEMNRLAETTKDQAQSYSPPPGLPTMGGEVRVIRRADSRDANKLVMGAQVSTPDALNALAHVMRAEVAKMDLVSIDQVMNVHPWDGARLLPVAVATVLRQGPDGFPAPEEKREIMTPFGPQPLRSKLIDVQTGPGGKHETVTIGTWTVPGWGMDEYLRTNLVVAPGRVQFRLMGETRRERADTVKQIVDELLKLIAERSLYKGKAIRVHFHDDDGSLSEDPERLTPVFVDVDPYLMAKLVYPDRTLMKLRTSLWGPIRFEDLLRERGGRRRGVLLYGTYGTGKSAAMAATATVCGQYGWTFVYVDRASDLPEALNFARQYEPAIVAVEDIDTISEGPRTDEMNRHLNAISSLDTKTSRVSIIATTNRYEAIHEAFKRPERFDSHIEIGFPDADAVAKLIKLYGGKELEEGDYGEAAGRLQGHAPALVAEAVERARIFAVVRTDGKDKGVLISPMDLSLAAEEVIDERRRAATSIAEQTSVGDLDNGFITGTLTRRPRRRKLRDMQEKGLVGEPEPTLTAAQTADPIKLLLAEAVRAKSMDNDETWPYRNQSTGNIIRLPNDQKASMMNLDDIAQDHGLEPVSDDNS